MKLTCVPDNHSMWAHPWGTLRIFHSLPPFPFPVALLSLGRKSRTRNEWAEHKAMKMKHKVKRTWSCYDVLMILYGAISFRVKTRIPLFTEDRLTYEFKCGLTCTHARILILVLFLFLIIYYFYSPSHFNIVNSILILILILQDNSKSYEFFFFL